MNIPSHIYRGISFFLLITISIFSSCSDKNHKEEEEILSDNEKINSFVETHMKDTYYWAEFITNKSISNLKEPENYFKEMVYYGDKWSRLTKESVQGELASTEDGYKNGFGFHVSGYSFTSQSSTTYHVKIEYVYPNTPASEAGLRRGDLITKIDNIDINNSNINNLLNAKHIKIAGKKKMTGDDFELNLTARKFDITPILKDTVITVNSTKIGYLCYTSFVYKNEQSLKDLNNIFAKFKNAGIDQLVLDLRYNGGGYANVAIHIASLIAPATNVINEDILIKKTWNKKYSELYKNRPSMLKEVFNKRVPEESQLNLNKLWVLTTGSTASASEVVISGLKPYMDVKCVGLTTTGKDAGGVVYTPTDSDISEWNAYLITIEYTNSANKSVKNGIKPDYTMEKKSSYYDTSELGDPADYYFARAIEEITGLHSRASSENESNQPLPIERIIHLNSTSSRLIFN